MKPVLYSENSRTSFVGALYKRVLADPLFAAEGLDIEGTDTAVARLADSVKIISNIWKQAITRLFFFKHEGSLHPIIFLQQFIICERFRRRFLELPNETTGRALIAAWNSAADAYLAGAMAYQNALLELQRMEDIQDSVRIKYFDSAPTFSEVLAWTDLLVENARLLKHEAEYFGEFDENKVTGEVLQGRIEKVALDDGLHILRSAASLEKKADTIVGPIVYPTSHFNEGQEHERVFYVSIGRIRESYPRQLEVFLADDFYFLNFEKGHFLDTVIYRPLIERGLPYWYQPATTYYSSLDLRYHADIATIADISLRASLFDRVAVSSQRSSMLDLLFERGVHFNMRFAQLLSIFRYHKGMPPLSFLYIARAYPSLYFLTFNRSVWRLRGTPSLVASRFGLSSPYEHFRDVRTKITFSDIQQTVEVSFKRMSYYSKEELGGIEY